MITKSVSTSARRPLQTALSELSLWEFSHGPAPAEYEVAAKAMGICRVLLLLTINTILAQLRFFKAFITGNEMSCSFYTRK